MFEMKMVNIEETQLTGYIYVYRRKYKTVALSAVGVIEQANIVLKNKILSTTNRSGYVSVFTS